MVKVKMFVGFNIQIFQVWTCSQEFKFAGIYSSTGNKNCKCVPSQELKLFSSNFA